MISKEMMGGPSPWDEGPPSAEAAIIGPSPRDEGPSLAEVAERPIKQVRFEVDGASSSASQERDLQTAASSSSNGSSSTSGSWVPTDSSSAFPTDQRVSPRKQRRGGKRLIQKPSPRLNRRRRRLKSIMMIAVMT